MALQVSVTFDMSPADGNGIIRLMVTDNDGTVPNDTLYPVRWSILGPGGIFVKQLPLEPDAEFANNESAEITLPLPKDGDGKYIPGAYVVRCLVADDVYGTNPVLDQSYTQYLVQYPNVEPQYEGPLIEVQFTGGEANCDTGEIKYYLFVQQSGEAVSIDQSTYDFSSENNVDLENHEDGSFSDGNNITEYFYYSGLKYTMAIEVIYTLTLNMSDDWTFYLIDRYTDFIETTPSCIPSDICNLAACLEDEFLKIDNAVCGDWTKVTAKQKGRLEKAQAIAFMAAIKKDCNNATDFETYYSSFTSLLSDCGCGCGDQATGPVRYYAPNPAD